MANHGFSGHRKRGPDELKEHNLVIRSQSKSRRKSTRASSGSGELAVTSIASSNLSSGLAAYGDDPQAAANYPLVRITNNRTGHVFYSRPHHHTSRLLHLALSALLISMCRQPPANPKAAPQRNQITRKLARSKFANWLLCFCHIRVLAKGRFN